MAASRPPEIGLERNARHRRGLQDRHGLRGIAFQVQSRELTPQRHVSRFEVQGAVEIDHRLVVQGLTRQDAAADLEGADQLEARQHGCALRPTGGVQRAREIVSSQGDFRLDDLVLWVGVAAARVVERGFRRVGLAVGEQHPGVETLIRRVFRRELHGGVAEGLGGLRVVLTREELHTATERLLRLLELCRRDTAQAQNRQQDCNQPHRGNTNRG